MGDDEYRIASQPSELTGPQLAKRQRVHSRSSQVASFDSRHRKDYLKGFRKRKTERKQKGRELLKHKERLAKTAAKKQRNKALYGDMSALLEEWDKEHEDDAKKEAAVASSQTAQAEQLEFGEGASATTVSIEPWDGEEDDEGGAETDEVGADADEFSAANILGQASASGLLSSKAKKDAWKPNTIKVKGKARPRQQWGDAEGNVEDEQSTTMSSELQVGDGDDGKRPDWWKKSRSERPAVSLSRQKRQKYIQGKRKHLKSKSAKLQKKLIKRAGGGKRGRGLKLYKSQSGGKDGKPKRKGKKGGGRKV